MADEQIVTEENTTESPATEEKVTQEQKPVTQETKETPARETVVTSEDKPKAEEKPYWPEDWREKAAEHYAAGDKKAYDRELKRLQRMSDPTALYGNYRELEAKFGKGGLIKVPGEDAEEKDIKEFRAAIGIPEMAEAYVENLALDEGLVLGDDDKDDAKAFAEAIHGATTPQEMVNNAFNWYLGRRIDMLAQLDENDENFRRTAETELKEEWGGSYNRNRNAISALFSEAPGGSNPEDPESFMANLLTGRLASGEIIGNSPAAIKWLNGMSRQVNPAATVIDLGKENIQSIDTEIKTIEETMRKNRRAYNNDPEMQKRYRELLEAQEGIQRRAS